MRFKRATQEMCTVCCFNLFARDNGRQWYTLQKKELTVRPVLKSSLSRIKESGGGDKVLEVKNK